MGFLSKLFRKAENKQQGKSAQEDDSASARQAQKKDSPTGSGELPHLLAQLQTNTYVRRLEAAAALAKLGDPAALPALEAMSHGTDDPWVLFDDEMRARAKIAYPSGVIPFADRDMLRSQLQGTNDRLKRAAQAAIAQIRESASLQTSEEAAMKVLDDAYLIRHDPVLEERISAALDQVARSESGTSALVARISRTVSVAAGKARVADHGDMTWIELLKVREVVKALGRAKSTDAVPALSALLTADSDYVQFFEIVQPAVVRGLAAIGTAEAVATLKGALTRSNVAADTTRAIQEALAIAEPAQASAVAPLLDISKRPKTGKVGCIAFRLKDPGRSSSLRKRLDAIPAAAAGTPAQVDAIFGALGSECSVERPYVYEMTFGSAWSKVAGDVVMVVDFETKWDAFEKKMQAQNYAGEPALLKAMAVNAKALDLTVQFLSHAGEVVTTL